MLTFGVSGKLIMNALVMFDRETNSLWSHFLSEGISGEFRGTRLRNVPLVLTTWGEWKRSFPNTKALITGGRVYDPYETYYQRSDPGVIGESNRDDRLPRKELVLGMGFDDGAHAFPHSVLQGQSVVNTELNGVPIVVYYHAQTETATAFDRRVDEAVLTFRIEEEPTESGLRDWLVDDATGTRWLPLTGQALSGDYSGRRLGSVHAVNIFWFAWNDFFPDTSVYGIE